MSGVAQLDFTEDRARVKAKHALVRRATTDPWWIKGIVLVLSVGFMGVLFVLPLALIFLEAFRNGWAGFVRTFSDADSWPAIRLTLQVAAIAVPLNTLFGLAAAWCIAQFRFGGKRLLTILIELPLWVSPVIAGLIYVLLFGRQGLWGPWLMDHDIKIIFALPGIVLSTIFVTFPFVARVVTPQMEMLGHAEEEAALTLGANGWQTFWRVTVPKIRWSLIYGIILCNARSMGEFGAVSVVSGHIRGRTNTVPLAIEFHYNDYHFVSAFTLATLLALVAIATLILKTVVAWRAERMVREALETHELHTHP